LILLKCLLRAIQKAFLPLRPHPIDLEKGEKQWGFHMTPAIGRGSLPKVQAV
jgi:hypothetical protein